MNSRAQRASSFVFSLFAVFSLSVVMAIVSGCKKPETTAADAGAPVAVYTTGQKVDINWKGSWWKGEVLEVKGEAYRVHYTGWSATWDEDVKADRLRPGTETAQVGSEAPAASAPVAAAVAAVKAAATPGYKVGDKVDVNWKGVYWQSKIIGTPAPGQFRIHYLGWGSNWDENVTAARMRAPVAGTKRGTGPE